MSFLTGKKLLLLGFLAVLLAVIPLTVFFLRSQTQTQSKAEKATSLYFALPSQLTPSTGSIQKNVGDLFNFDIILSPGTNQVIATTLFITYDPTKLQLGENRLRPRLIESAGQTEGFTSILAGPTYTNGSASVTLTVGVDITKVIKTTQKIATISFKAINAAAETKVTFDESRTNATSSVDPEVNVLLPNPAPVSIVITQAGVTASPSATPILNQLPVCTGLSVDRATAGAAPFSISFTANGNDLNGTINSATFDFADGPVQTVTQGGNIGTKTVSLQVAHTYNNPGTYKAKVTFTDNNNGISATTDTCSQTITVTTGSVGIGTTGTPTPLIVTATPIQPTIATPGPSSAIYGIGIVGLALTILGGLLFFSL